jgi:hypothetical protein
MQACNDKDVWDLELCKNINLLREAEKIILYGAGGKGQEILGWLQDAGIRVDEFWDIDVKKWGNSINNVNIKSPYEWKDSENKGNNGLYVIACIQYPNELFELLGRMGTKRPRVITYWGIKTAIQIHAVYTYQNNPERLTVLQIDNLIRKNRFINMGIEYIRSLITASDDAIWVIQPGKTASSSLGVRLLKYNIPFYSGHYLKYPNHIIGEEYRSIWERLIQKKRDLKIITAVREPLSRDYSAFWQAFTEDVQHIMRMPILENDFQKMYDAFIHFILKGSAYTKEVLKDAMPYTWNDEFEWFDEQIKENLGIDVFQYPFDREKGYAIIKKDNIEIFLFKVEKMDNISDEIGKFAGRDRLPDINANVAERKWYSLAYAQLRKEIILKPEYVNHYYQGNMKMNHFYTQEEKAKFLRKWQGNIG